MNRAILAALLLAVTVSCAGSVGTLTPPQRQSATLVAQLRVEKPPASMPDAERIALEAASFRVVASGSAAVPAILADLEVNRDANRRDVLEKLLAIITAGVSDTARERETCDKEIREANRKMLASDDSSDRYLGLVLAGLGSGSRVIPTAIVLLEDRDPATRSSAFAMLRASTGYDFGFRADAPDDVRKAAVKRWNTWWSKSKDKKLYSSHTPAADPVLAGFNSQFDEISRSAGPYLVSVTDKATGKAVDGAIVACSYSFRTLDNHEILKKDQGVTDSNGKFLMAAQAVSAGARFSGAEVIIAKAGYAQENITFAPHLLTPNSFAADVTLEPEAKSLPQ